MNHHATHYHGASPLAWPWSGRCALAQPSRRNRNRRRPRWRWEIALFMVLFFSLAAALACLQQAIRDFDRPPVPATPAPTPRVQLHTPESDSFREPRTEPAFLL